MDGLLWVTIVLIVLFFIVMKTIVIVPTRGCYILERLGNFRGALGPGFHFLVPFFDRIAYRQEIREQIIDIPPQSCITKDNMQVEVDGVVYLKVIDAKLASYGIDNYRIAAINLAQTTMRSEIGKLALHETFAERDQLNSRIVNEIDKASDPWGIKVLRYELMNITPSSQVVHTLEKVMEAERSRRVEVTLATAHKEAVSLVSMGERQQSIAISEGEKMKRINEAEGRAQEISILAEATAYGIERIAKAIEQKGGNVAVKMRIVESFIDQFTSILKEAKVQVVPQQLANIKGFFEGIGKVSDTIPSSSKK